MKFRWIPALILISMLLGVMIGIRINDLTGLFSHSEEKVETAETVNVKSQELNKVDYLESTELNKVESLNCQEQSETENVESAEVFLNSSDPILQEVRSESGFLSKVGRNLDKGVSTIFSKLISRII
jgi:precorrin-6B methylase 1